MKQKQDFINTSIINPNDNNQFNNIMDFVQCNCLFGIILNILEANIYFDRNLCCPIQSKHRHIQEFTVK